MDRTLRRRREMTGEYIVSQSREMLRQEARMSDCCWLMKELIISPKTSIRRGRAMPWAAPVTVPMNIRSQSNGVEKLNCGGKGGREGGGKEGKREGRERECKQTAPQNNQSYVVPLPLPLPLLLPVSPHIQASGHPLVWVWVVYLPCHQE